MRPLIGIFLITVALVVGWTVVVIGPFAWRADSYASAAVGAILLLFGPTALAGGAIAWLVAPHRRSPLRILELGALACTVWAVVVFSSIVRSRSPHPSGQPLRWSETLCLLVFVSDMLVVLIHVQTRRARLAPNSERHEPS